MYKGELAERLKIELLRRASLIKGRASHIRTNAFSGLLICDSCGCRMGYMKKEGRDWHGYYCHSNERRYEDTPRASCDSNPRFIIYEDVQAWVHRFLTRALKRDKPVATIFDGYAPDESRVEQLQDEIEKVERRIAGLMLQRADTPPASQSILTELLEKEDERLQNLRTQLQIAQRNIAASRRNYAASEASFEELRAIGLDNFWQLPPDTINRILFGLFGHNRMWVRDGEIVGVRPHEGRGKTENL
jgi:hypothetical protein